jgi:hypothetical protein
MKIVRVRANSRKRQFEVDTRKRTLVFPFAHADPAPSPKDPLKEVFVDAELGREALTYSLASGAEGTVHLDSILEYNQDPNYMAELALYQLTTEARKKFDASSLSAREVARRLSTSPTQLYRLLDPANYAKSMRQLLSLLYVLGYDVEVEVKHRTSERVAG